MLEAAPPRSHAVGALLRQARLAVGWSQRELAHRAGVHQPQIARIERGDDIQVSLLERVARPLGVTTGLVDPSLAGTAHELHDHIDEQIATWRTAWPHVDPDVFAVLTRLRLAGGHVERAIELTAGLHAMSGKEMIVLGTLRRKGPPYESTPTGLKQLLWISLPGLKKRLDRLETLGMVTRVSNPRDRRGQVVRLTQRGHAALDDLVAHPQATVYGALLEMPKTQLAQLSAHLRDLLARLESEDGCEAPR